MGQKKPQKTYLMIELAAADAHESIKTKHWPDNVEHLMPTETF